MAGSEQHAKRYKNSALDQESLRKQREEEGIQLRKQKRDEQFMKRRNFDSDDMETSVVADDMDSSKPTVDESLITHLYSDELPHQLYSLQKLSKFLSQNDHRHRHTQVIDAVIQSGIVPRLVVLLQSDGNVDIQIEACKSLTNISAGVTEQTRVIIKSGVIPVLIRCILSSKSVKLIEQAFLILGNIAADSVEYRNYILNEGTLPAIIKLTGRFYDHPVVPHASSWCLLQIVRQPMTPLDFERVQIILPCLAAFLAHTDADVVANSAVALSYLSSIGSEHIQVIIAAGVCKRLISLLTHGIDRTAFAALRTVGNFVAANDEQTQVVLNCNVIPHLVHLLKNGNESVRSEVCLILSNIACGNCFQIETLIEAKIFEMVVELLQGDTFRVQRQATRIILNALSVGTAYQVRRIASVRIVPVLCGLLVVPDVDVIGLALGALSKLLERGCCDPVSQENPYILEIERCNGLDAIESLQNHPNRAIYDLTSDIIDKYFSGASSDCDDEQMT